MTELRKNEVLRLTRTGHTGRDLLIDFDSEADLLKFLGTPPGPPYPDDQLEIALWDIDAQETIWENSLTSWLEIHERRNSPATYSPYLVKSLVFYPMIDPVTKGHGGYTSLEQALGSREQVRAYLAGTQDTSGYVVILRGVDGTVIFEQNADDWLDQHFPDREKPLSMIEEVRKARMTLDEAVEVMAQMAATMREALEVFRPPIVYAFPDHREGRVEVETQEGPIDQWREGVDGLDYEDWVYSQPWPEGADYATMDRHGGCCWWASRPIFFPDSAYGWSGALRERYYDSGMPFRGVEWKLSRISKKEYEDAKTADEG